MGIIIIGLNRWMNGLNNCGKFEEIMNLTESAAFEFRVSLFTASGKAIISPASCFISEAPGEKRQKPERPFCGASQRAG
jgi:hypothetical protein